MAVEKAGKSGGGRMVGDDVMRSARGAAKRPKGSKVNRSEADATLAMAAQGVATSAGEDLASMGKRDEDPKSLHDGDPKTSGGKKPKTRFVCLFCML